MPRMEWMDRIAGVKENRESSLDTKISCLSIGMWTSSHSAKEFKARRMPSGKPLQHSGLKQGIEINPNGPLYFIEPK